MQEELSYNVTKICTGKLGDILVMLLECGGLRPMRREVGQKIYDRSVRFRRIPAQFCLANRKSQIFGKITHKIALGRGHHQ